MKTTWERQQKTKRANIGLHLKVVIGRKEYSHNGWWPEEVYGMFEIVWNYRDQDDQNDWQPITQFNVQCWEKVTQYDWQLSGNIYIYSENISILITSRVCVSVHHNFTLLNPEYSCYCTMVCYSPPLQVHACALVERCRARSISGRSSNTLSIVPLVQIYLKWLEYSS